MAPPSKLSPDTQDKICQLIRAGNTIELAAAVTGISESTFFGWMERGRQMGKKNKPHRDFRAAVEKARAENEAILVAQISKEANRSWRAATWLLERRYPERWAPLNERKNADSDEAATKDPLAEVDELAQRRTART